MDKRETGLKPLNDFRLKAGLQREGSRAQTSPSEYRLQPEACEGLQARVHGNRALCRVTRLPATAARSSMRPRSGMSIIMHPNIMLLSIILACSF